MIEKDVERRLCALARRHGGVALKWTSPGTMGVPDRLVFLPGGRLYLVEVKRPGGRPRESRMAGACGGRRGRVLRVTSGVADRGRGGR